MNAAAAIAIFGLLTASPAMPAPVRADYGPDEAEFASLTLRVNSAGLSVEILDQHDLAMRLIPANSQGTAGLRAFAIDCASEPNYRVSVIDTRLDGNFHLIPADVLEYSTEFPSDIKLQFNTLYFRNKINDPDLGKHTLLIRFFTHPN